MVQRNHTRVNKKVSIIIPVYNAEKYIEECIDSVLAQDYDNMEIIVVNDGSTDGSEKKLTQFKKEIIYVKQENAGGSAARNAGLKMAKGDFIFFLDADDVLAPGAIARMVNAIESENYDICIGNHIEIDECGEKIRDAGAFKSRIIYRDFNSLAYLFSIYPNPSTKLYRSEIIKGNNLNFCKLPIAQDLDFYFKYLFCSKSAIGISDVIYSYRIAGGSISRSYDERIVGIVDAFDDVANFADGLGLSREFTTHLQNVELMHICYQIDKLGFVRSRNAREWIYSKLIGRARKLTVNRKSPTYKNAKENIIRLKMFRIFGYSRFARILARLVTVVLI